VCLLKFEPNKLFTHLRQVSPSSSRRAPEFSNYQKAIIIALRQRAYKGRRGALYLGREKTAVPLTVIINAPRSQNPPPPPPQQRLNASGV
jgi:hypothetical protein